MKKLFDEIPYLEGERVVLRKIVEEDRETLWEMAHSSIIYRYEPTYLLEQQYSDMDQLFRDLYGDNKWFCLLHWFHIYFYYFVRIRLYGLLWGIIIDYT